MATNAFVQSISEFTSSDSTDIDTFLAIAKRLIDATNAGENYSELVGYLTAHMLKLLRIEEERKDMGAQGAAGPITSLKTGGESVGFANITTVDLNDAVSLSETTYGRLYLMIRGQTYDDSPAVIQ